MAGTLAMPASSDAACVAGASRFVAATASTTLAYIQLDLDRADHPQSRLRS